jgi:hypothetical protein
VKRDAQGNVVLVGGYPVATFERSPLASRVRARRQHLEDWISFLVFIHLFAGADAFVAAHLQDMPVSASLAPGRGGGLAVAARLAW